MFAFLILATLLSASPAELQKAHDLYRHTEYRKSLDILQHLATKDPATLELIGQNYFMLGDYKKASEALEKAASLEPEDAHILYWLGRTYARRAETANPFSAPG